MLRYEQAAWASGVLRVAGVDEAGRGPLAGPVVAAAVLFDAEFLQAEAQRSLVRLTDSKKVTAKSRESFFKLLTASPDIQFSIGIVDAGTIDRINILRATHLAMSQALDGMNPLPDLALVDGRPVPGLPCEHRAIVRGDGLSLSIAAASIIAKVTRDRLMDALDIEYPEYGFARHKGYGTALHLEALRRIGPAPCHRRSFAPVRNCM